MVTVTAWAQSVMRRPGGPEQGPVGGLAVSGLLPTLKRSPTSSQAPIKPGGFARAKIARPKPNPPAQDTRIDGDDLPSF